MAKGYRRQGDWQTGYVQRTTDKRDAKVSEQYAIQLAKQAEERVKKREASSKQLEQEAQRIFNLQTGLDSYDVSKAADMSQTFKTFMTQTVKSLAKDAQDFARAQGAADAISEDFEEGDKEIVTETVYKDKEGNVLNADQLKAIQETANSNLDLITKVEQQVAKPLEEAGYKDRANKSRGLFSSAYDWGWKIQTAKTAVQGFEAHLKTELDSSEILLQRKDDEEPWMIKDAGNDKDKLKFASGYILNKFVDENNIGLTDVITAEVLEKPGRKVIAKELKTRFDAVDLEFKQNQISGITNTLAASMEMVPGAPSLWKDLTTLEDRLRPYLTPTATQSKGALLKKLISDTYQDVISRSENPELVRDNFLAVTQGLKLDSSMGQKTLAEIDSKLFGEDAINKVYMEVMAKRYSNDVRGQKQGATLAILNKSKEISQKMADEGKPRDHYASEMLLFKAELLKEYPYAAGEITNLLSKFYNPTLGESDTILEIKRSYVKNNGVVLSKDLEGVNLDVAKIYLENNSIPLVEESPSEIFKEHIREKEKDAEKLFDKVGKIAGVTIISGNEREAVDQFKWEVHQRALALQQDANKNNVTLTYKEAYDTAYQEKEAEVKAGFVDKTSKWYLTIGDNNGGFKYFDKPNVDPFETNLPDINTFTKASQLVNGRNGKVIAKRKWILDPSRLTLLGNGYSSDPLVQRLSRVFGLTEKEFVDLQRGLFPAGTDFGDVDDTDDGIISGNANRSKAANDLKILGSKGNSDSKVVKKAIDEIVPLGALVLSNHFLDNLDLENVLRNEVTGHGLLLGPGKTEIKDGVLYTGHRLYGTTSLFGERPSPFDPTVTEDHYGIDIGTSQRTNVRTAFFIKDGTVIENTFDYDHDIEKGYSTNSEGEWSGGKAYGNMITIRDNETGAIYRFAHLLDGSINPDLTVGSAYTGQYIGIIGSSGRSSLDPKTKKKLPHLHFEKIVDGVPVDPIEDLDRLSLGQTINNGEGFVGKYPIRRNLVSSATREALGRNWGMSIKDFLKNEKAQDKVWKYLNEQAWSKAFEYANGDQFMAVRYHVALILTGDMDNYNDPTISNYTNAYMENLRTSGAFK